MSLVLMPVLDDTSLGRVKEIFNKDDTGQKEFS